MSALRVVTALVRAEVADKVDAAAASMARSSDAIVEEALADWLAHEDWKYRATLEGLEDVRAGRTVDNDRVMAWLDSFDTDLPLPCPEP